MCLAILRSLQKPALGAPPPPKPPKPPPPPPNLSVATTHTRSSEESSVSGAEKVETYTAERAMGDAEALA